MLAALVAVTLGGAACDGGDPPGKTGGPGAAQAYTARGLVLEVTDDAWTLHHEAIDDFVGSDGRVTGMDSMVMRFHLGPGMRRAGVGKGDKIQFRFEVRTEGPRHVITEASKLPRDTAIDFRAARPAGGG